MWKLRLSIQPSSSAILFCHPLWLKGVIYQSLVFICRRVQRQCCSCWFSMLTGYQSNRETQISCTAVAKLPRKFSLRCICSPGLQRTLQWQQRIMIIHHNKPYRYAQFMYIERNICIKIYPPYFATRKYAISCECARLTCLLEPRCVMVLVSMVAYRDGWENWAASCLGEYTEKDMQNVSFAHRNSEWQYFLLS